MDDDEPVRDVQLLDEEDDSTNTNGIGNDMPLYSSSVKIQSNTSNFSMSINSNGNKGNFTASTGSDANRQAPSTPLVTGMSGTLGRPSSLSRFKISPNDPSANYQKKMELKSIARPRSRSSSRFASPSSQIGIEQYVELYSSQTTSRAR